MSLVQQRWASTADAETHGSCNRKYRVCWPFLIIKTQLGYSHLSIDAILCRSPVFPFTSNISSFFRTIKEVKKIKNKPEHCINICSELPLQNSGLLSIRVKKYIESLFSILKNIGHGFCSLTSTQKLCYIISVLRGKYCFP